MADQTLPLVGTVKHDIVGYAKTLPINTLPTKGDVLRALFYLREEETTVRQPKPKDITVVLDQCADQIIAVWLRASLPQLITKKSIKRQVVKLHDEYRKIIKCVQSNRSTQNVQQFTNSTCKALFDICSCRCSYIAESLRGKMLCKCEERMRILCKEADFLFDQRGPRKMVISETPDSYISAQYKRSQERILSSYPSGSSQPPIVSSAIEPILVNSPNTRPRPHYENLLAENDEEETDDTDFIYKPRYKKARYCNPVSQKSVRDADKKFSTIRAHSDAINNTLHAINDTAQATPGHELVEKVVSKSTTSKSSTWRHRSQHRAEAVVELNDVLKKINHIQLGFDGKKILKRERYIFNGIFDNNDSRGNVILEVKTFDDNVAASTIADYIQAMDREILEKVRVVVADTTSLNTGCRQGIFTRLKTFFKQEFGYDIHTVECQIHIIELLFRHFFLEIEGPSKSPDKLPVGSVYNLIGKVGKPNADLLANRFITVPNEVEQILTDFVLKYCNDRQNYGLRDDHACLLAWTLKIAGLLVPDSMVRFLSYKQESYGFARWITSATGYLRIYGSESLYTTLSEKQSNDLKVICRFICSVYTPAYFFVYFNPSVTSGTNNMIKIRNLLINSNKSFSFPDASIMQVKKIFINHALAWLDNENVALAVFSDDNLFTVENMKQVTNCKTIDQRKKMLWSTKYSLKSFMTVDAMTAPCLKDEMPDKSFWQAAMNNNRSCERYIGRIKEILERKLIRDIDSDKKMKGILALQDLESLVI